MSAGAYAAAGKFGKCPVCHGQITAVRKMSWLRRFLYTNLNLFPHAVWIAGYIGHRSCVEVMARLLWNGTLAFDDAGLPMYSLRSVSTRRRPGSRTRLRGVAARYLCRSVRRRSQAEPESNRRPSA